MWFWSCHAVTIWNDRSRNTGSRSFQANGSKLERCAMAGCMRGMQATTYRVRGRAWLRDWKSCTRCYRRTGRTSCPQEAGLAFSDATQGNCRDASMNALVVAGTASGAGKTTIALAIIAALRAREMTAQPFKCGSDFIDGGHLTIAAGCVTRNLDTWMLDAQANREIFFRASAPCDVAVVEGMMGLFDGVTG